MYVCHTDVATVPLIKNHNNCLGTVNQVWYADDASMAGKITELHVTVHVQVGLKCGYFAHVTTT